MAANERAARRFRPAQEQEDSLYDSTEIVDDSGDLAASQAASGLTPSQRAGLAAAKSVAGGGSTEDVIAGGLMASGNPYAIAAGAGIQVLSASKKREQANKELQYKAKLERISRQQRALESMTGVAQSLRNL